MNEIPSPYNFVPAAEQIQFVEAPISHDHPYEDGVCGTIDLAVVNETPLFIRGTTQPDRSYQVHGHWAIPGSSVRGLIRNVVEIASFSRLGPINDLRYGFRDLQNRELYSQHMAALVNQKPTPKVSASWLTLTPGSVVDQLVTPENAEDVVATLRVVDFARVEYKFLRALATKNFDIGARNSAPRRYDGMGISRGELCLLTVPLGAAIRAHGQVLEGYRTEGEVTEAAPGGKMQDGVLVVTGQATDLILGAPKKPGNGNPKHHDFFFYGADRIVVNVSRKQFADFEFIHAAEADHHGQRVTPNPEWDFWEETFRKGKPVPVFAVFKAGNGPARELRSFGLCSMFRMAFDYTTGDALRNTQQEVDSTRVDFAEAMFGRVPRAKVERSAPDPNAIDALKGRVSFDTLLGPIAPGVGVELAPVKAVFGAPKASFYPNYLDQTSAPHGGYKTYMNKDVKLRGWKRYRLQNAVTDPPLPDKVRDHQISTFRPLRTQTLFSGSVRVHNLRLHELGALLWAMEIGGGRRRHGLGLGKPYGYGRVQISVASASLRMNHQGEPGRNVLEEAKRAFMQRMTDWCAKAQLGAWESSGQIKNLLELAMPVDGNPLHLRYPVLKPNQFVEAKTQRLYLRPLVAFTAVRVGIVLPPAAVKVAAPTGPAPAGLAAAPKPAAVAPATPAKSPGPVVDPADAADAEAVRKAVQMGGPAVVDLVNRWKVEGGARLEARRKAIQKAKALTPKQIKNNPELGDWA